MEVAGNDTHVILDRLRVPEIPRGGTWHIVYAGVVVDTPTR